MTVLHVLGIPTRPPLVTYLRLMPCFALPGARTSKAIPSDSVLRDLQYYYTHKAMLYNSTFCFIRQVEI